jgi:hypothetical protein
MANIFLTRFGLESAEEPHKIFAASYTVLWRDICG